MGSAPAESGQALLRREKIKLRQALSVRQRQEKSERILEQVLGLPQYRKAGNILCYASFGAEVSTKELILKSLSLQKSVYCPRVEEDRIRFYRIDSPNDLSEGFHKIPEPDAKSPVYRESPDTLVIVPGTVFDRCGHRIGYGGGYYDRFLAGLSKSSEGPFFVGVCFSCQLAENICPKPHDVPMDLVIFA